MQLLYRLKFLLFLLPLLAFAPLFLSSRANKGDCSVEYGEPKRFSAQKNATIYNEVFGNEGCSPDKLVLGIPVNAVEKNKSNEIEEVNQYRPKISTIITSSNKPKAFNIRRIDRNKDGYFYSNKETCLAWNWREEDQQQVLDFTMERNLQINNSELQEIIFIVSLPLEVQSGKTKIIVNRHVKDKIGSSTKINLKEYPETKFMLKEDSELSEIVIEDLKNIVQQGGFFYDKSLAQFIRGKFKKPYADNPDTSYCAIPQDWKK